MCNTHKQTLCDFGPFSLWSSVNSMCETEEMDRKWSAIHTITGWMEHGYDQHDLITVYNHQYGLKYSQTEVSLLMFSNNMFRVCSN